MKKLLNIHEVVDLVGLSRVTIWRLCLNDKLGSGCRPRRPDNEIVRLTIGHPIKADYPDHTGAEQVPNCFPTP